MQGVTTLLIVLRMGHGVAYAQENTSYRSPSADQPPLEERVTAPMQRPVVNVSGLVVDAKTDGKQDSPGPNSATSETPLRHHEGASRWQNIV